MRYTLDSFRVFFSFESVTSWLDNHPIRKDGSFFGKKEVPLEKRLTVLQMNDSHAYFDLHPEVFWEKGRATYRMAGGYARLATLIKQIRKENPGRVLLADGGDTFHGTYPAVQTKGEALVPIMNALAPDAMTAHWEYAYTPQGFEALTRQLNYPMLAMNVYHKDSQQLQFKPSTVVETSGMRIGLAGIASNIVDKTMPPQFSQGMCFTNGREELPGVVHALRNQEQVDLVVLVSHLGFPQDMQLLSELPGIDVDLSAHTHHRLERAAHQNGTLITQSGSHGSFLTRLDLIINHGRVVDYSHQLLEVSAAIEPDPEINHLVEEAIAPFHEELEEIVGETRLPLDRSQNLESSMDNLLLAAVRNQTGAQVAFSNGWRYGAPILPGPIRMNDLYNLAPMNPPVSTVEMHGEEIWSMLEENLEHTFSRDPLKQMGGYLKRVAGLRVFIKIENPPGQRIQKIFVGEEEIQPEKIYQAAFITEQGVPAKYGQNRQALPQRTADILRTYLKKVGTIEIALNNPFVVI